MKVIIETYKYIDSFEINKIEFRDIEDYFLIILNNSCKLIYTKESIKKMVFEV